MSRVLRLAAGGLASLAGCSIEETEDIKLAVSEILLVLVEHCDSSGPVEMELSCDDSAFAVNACCPATGFDIEHEDIRLSRTVLEGLGARPVVKVRDSYVEFAARLGRGTYG